VIARGNAGGRIVLDDDDRRSFVAALSRISDHRGWRVHAYCLMDTHLHLVVETPEPNLGSGMGQLLGRHAHRFNRRHDRFGHLFAGPFSASIVKTEPYAIQVCAYVVLNPVRAALVEDPDDWAWSSYRATAGLIDAPAFLETRLMPRMPHPNLRRSREIYREHIRDLAEHPRPGSG
jgi:putative transposase